MKNEKLAVDKKLQATVAQEKQNKTKFDANTSDLNELQKLTGSKTSNEISQANMLADEALINYKQAQKIRDESNAYPSGSAKLGGLGNAEEKENEALLKQQKAIDLLLKVNPNYKVKNPAGSNNPAEAIASLNKEINKTAQSQLDAYSELSKTNQNELKLQNDKLAKNPALNTNSQAADLKKESDNLNNEAKGFIAQSSNAASVSEKANLLLKANDKEIEALKKLNDASALLTNTDNNIAVNTNTISTNTTENTTDTNSSQNKTTNTDNAQNTTVTTDTNNTTTDTNNTQNIAATTTDTNTSQNKTNPDNTQNTATNTTDTNTSQNKTNPDNTQNTATNTTDTNTSQNKTNPDNAVSSNTIAPTNTDLSSDINKLKAGLNNTTEGNLTSFNAYNNTEAISIKEKATEKINAALNEDKNIIATLDNVNQLNTSSPSQNVSQDGINTTISEAEKNER